MKFLFGLSTSMMFLYSFSLQFTVSQAASCTRIHDGVMPLPNCTNYVEIQHKTVKKDQLHVRIFLPEPLTSVRWFCGKHDGRLDWAKTGKKANEIRVDFTAGELKFIIYRCDDLSGPKKEANCTYNVNNNYACPGPSTSDHVCVYEIKETKESTTTKAVATQITGELAADIKNHFTGMFSMSYLRQRIEIKTETYFHKSYIFVPSGYRFCSYNEAKAVKDALAPTGYKWQCYSPKFLQGKTSGGCTNSPLCSDVPCATDKAGEVISPFNVLMLLVTAAVVTLCF